MTDKRADPIVELAVQAWISEWHNKPQAEQEEFRRALLRSMNERTTQPEFSNSFSPPHQEDVPLTDAYTEEDLQDLLQSGQCEEVAYEDGSYIYRYNNTGTIFVVRTGAANKKTTPPQGAGFLITLLMSEKQQEAILGDLEERFAADCKRYGAERARRYYWASTLRSLLPLAIRYLRHVRTIALFEAARKLLGV